MSVWKHVPQNFAALQDPTPTPVKICLSKLYAKGLERNWGRLSVAGRATCGYAEASFCGPSFTALVGDFRSAI